MMRATRSVLFGVVAVSFAGCFDRGGLDPTGDGGVGTQPDAGRGTGGALGTGGTMGSGGQSGSGGSKGSGGTSGTGGSIGSGGSKGSGGTTGSGGGAGMPATGGVRGSGGVIGTGGNPGTGGTTCGPVCLIFCPYGNVPDANGCPTCKCNPAPACTATECGPGLGIPSQVCSNGTIAGPVCLRDPTGKCVWAIFTCPPPPPSACGSHIGTSACIADTACAWLQPGCGDPALAAAGCYAKASIDCTSDAQCATGQQCLKRAVNPCDPTTMVMCGTCAVIRTVCQ